MEQVSAVFHSGGMAPTVVLVFRKKYGGDSEKNHTKLIKDRKALLILRDSSTPFM